MLTSGAELVLTIDAGTGGGRAAVYDLDGELRASAARRWAATTPPELAPFGREYDPSHIRERLDDAVREVLASVGAPRVRGIAVTGQRIACAFLDAAGETIYLGPNADVRALAGADLADLDAEALYDLTGRFPPWIYAPARLRWFAAARPETHARIDRVTSLPGWYAHRLSGQIAVDPSIAADLMMWDVKRARRAPPTSHVRWPEVRSAEQVLGTVREELADAWGLRSETVVAIGGADTQLALYGAAPAIGHDRGPPDDVLVAGSSAPLIRVLPGYRSDPKRRLWIDPHAVSGVWLGEANLGEMGTLHRWLLETMLIESYEAFDELARTAPLGCRGATSHLGPRAMNLRDLNTARPAAMLMPFGETLSTEPPGRAELLRSYLESCAFAVRAGRAWLDEAFEGQPAGLRVVGGLSASPLLGDIIASVLTAPVTRGPADATARGAAMCAAVAAGLRTSVAEAALTFARGGVLHEPDEDDAEDYEDAYDRWFEREEHLEEM